MKRYISIFGLATMLLGLMSCSSDEGTDNTTAGTAALQLNTEIATTRSIIEGTTFTNGDVVKLFLSGAYNGVNEATATYVDGKWQISPAVVMNNQSLGIGGLANMVESIAPDANGDQKDILVGAPVLADGYALNAANSVANMRFYHALSRVTFQLTQSNGNGHLTQVSLVNLANGKAIGTQLQTGYVNEVAMVAANNFAKEGLTKGSNPTTAQLSSAIAAAQKTLESIPSDLGYYLRTYNHTTAANLVMPTDIKLSETTTAVSLLAIPTTISSSARVALELVIDGGIYQVELPSVTWNSGYNYIYPVSIDVSQDYPSPLTLGSSTIEKWGSTTSLDGTTVNTLMDY